jgi:hypothetical protein
MTCYFQIELKRDLFIIISNKNMKAIKIIELSIIIQIDIQKNHDSLKSKQIKNKKKNSV